jgi:hypothetical protein
MWPWPAAFMAGTSRSVKARLVAGQWLSSNALGPGGCPPICHGVGIQWAPPRPTREPETFPVWQIGIAVSYRAAQLGALRQSPDSAREGARNPVQRPLAQFISGATRWLSACVRSGAVIELRFYGGHGAVGKWVAGGGPVMDLARVASAQNHVRNARYGQQPKRWQRRLVTSLGQPQCRLAPELGRGRADPYGPGVRHPASAYGTRCSWRGAQV